MHTSRMVSKKNWNYRYAVLDPNESRNGIGTPHVAELNAIWGGLQGSPPSFKTTNADMIPVLQHYWISFRRALDLNTLRLEGTPVWEEWSSAGFDKDGNGRRRILFQNGGAKEIKMETVGGPQRERCRQLTRWGVSLAQ